MTALGSVRHDFERAIAAIAPAAATSLGFLGEKAEQFGDRVVVVIDNPFFQRDDRVVGDMDMFRTNFGATFGDIAES